MPTATSGAWVRCAESIPRRSPPVADAGYVPVIAPIGVDDDGVTHNVNGDEAAGAVAQALHAEKLILLTDVEGVLDGSGSADPAAHDRRGAQAHHRGDDPRRDDPEDRVLHQRARIGRLRTHIVDGRILHAILLEIFTDTGVGTLLGR
jgi:acetylglutamate kinase